MKERKKQILLIAVLLLTLVGIGYAALQSNLNIIGLANIPNAKWDIHFDNITITNGSVEINESTGDSAATINPNDNTEVIYSVTLNKPGDFYEFLVDVKNFGTVDGMIGLIASTIQIGEDSPISILDDNSNLPSYLDYNITYSDDVKIEPNHELKAGEKETYKVRLEFKTDLEPSDLPTTTRSLRFSMRPKHVQADDSAILSHKMASSITCKSDTNYTGSSIQSYLSSDGCESYINGSVTDAGTYIVKCNGDSTHNDSTCNFTINKVPAILSCTNKTYNENEQTACTCTGGTIGGDYKATDAGSYTASCEADSNHTNPADVTWTMNKRTVSVTAPIVRTNITYNGTLQSLLSSSGGCGTGGTIYYYTGNPSTSSSAPTFSLNSNWTTSYTNFTAISAGTYYIYYYCYVSDTDNNQGSYINKVRYVTATISNSTSNYNWQYYGAINQSCQSDCQYSCRSNPNASDAECTNSSSLSPAQTTSKGIYCWCRINN